MDNPKLNLIVPNLRVPERNSIVALVLSCLLFPVAVAANSSPALPGSTGGQTDLSTQTAGSTDNGAPLPCDPPAAQVCGEAAETDVGSTEGSMQPMSQIGNPVSVVTGNKYQRENDYQSGISKLQFNRHYNSYNGMLNNGLGQGWTSSYSTQLIEIDGAGYDIVQGTGQRIQFRDRRQDDNGQSVFRNENYAMGSIATRGNKSIWYLRDGRQLHFTGSFLVRIEYPGAQFLNLVYRNRMLASVEDEAGRLLLFDYYESKNGLAEFSQDRFGAQANHLAKLTLPDGVVIEYDYDDKSNLSRVRYSDGTSRIFAYDDTDHPNHLTSITDRTGVKFASWTYHEDGRAASSEHANGVEKLEIVYTEPEPGQDIGYTVVVDSLGRTNEYTWQRIYASGQSMLLSSDGPGCSTCPVPNMRYSYNQQYQLSTAANVNGRLTRIEYDELGRVSDIYVSNPGVPEVHQLQNEYDGDSPFPFRISKPSVNAQGRHVVAIDYNEDQLPQRITETGFAPDTVLTGQFSPLVRTTELSYVDGLISTIDGPRTDVEDITLFKYDPLRRLVQVAMPTGQVMNMGDFDAHGRAKLFQTGDQSPLTMQYDANGQITEIAQHGERIKYQYDAEGRLTGLSGPDGKSIILVYDEAGRLTQSIDDLGLISEYINDNEGRITDKTFYGLNGELLRSISYAFDAEGRLQSANERSTNYSVGTAIDDQTDFQYDEFGRLMSRSDPVTGGNTDIAYDAFGRLSSIVNGASEVAQIAYDQKGQDIGFTDSRNNHTQFLKDDFGRVVMLVSPDTGTTLYSYDKSGNRVRKVNANGDIFNYQWDAGDRLVREENPSDTHTYQYHPSNGRLTQSSNSATTEDFSYNREAQLIEHTRELDGHRLSTGYRYAPNGKILKKLLPDGQTLNYHYHEDGSDIGTLRAITRETLFGLTQETLVAEIDMNKRDGSAGYLAHNGVRTHEQYYPNGEIKSIDAISTMRMDYTFDDDGKITGINIDNDLQSYYYQNGNLVEASSALGDFHYQYDSTGNRVSSGKSLAAGTVENTSYDYARNGAGNRLLSMTNETTGQSDTFEYNQTGALLRAANGYSYEYSADQRPTVAFKDGNKVAEYHYNSFGERVKKVVYNTRGTKVTYYLYDGKSLSAEIDVAGTVATQYVYLDKNKPVLKLQGGQRYAIHTDHIGTPRRLSDDAGQLVWDADYEPFGKASVTVELIEMNLRFPGQYLDAETQTHYNYFRQYDPATGRYISSDPIGLQGGNNSYAYADNLPIGLTDVLGLATDPDAPTPVLMKPESDAFESKMGAVIDYAIQKLQKDGADAVFAKALEDFKQTAIVLGGLAVALGVGIAAAGAATGGAAIPVALAGLGAAAAAIGARALWITGFQGVAFIYKLISLGMDVASTDHEDCAGLQKAGDDLFDIAVDTGSEVVQNVVTFGVGKIVDKLSGAFKVAKLTGSVRGLCSFHGDTLVLTRNGKKPIKNILANRDEVYAQDADTGKKGWKKVLAAYSNRYQSQIHITAVSAKGIKQKITSNRIHPFFTRLAAASLISVSSASYSINSEGHDYNGPIEGGQWVDAQYLEKGSELLSQTDEWLTVEAVQQESAAFDAYNLTVAEYSTYYISGQVDTDSVWVHNNCWDVKPAEYRYPRGTVYGKQVFENVTGGRVYRAWDIEQGKFRWFDANVHPISRTSLIGATPTTPNAVRSGLNNNMKNKDMRPTAGGPYQAHHIVTWQNWNDDGPVKDMLNDILFNMNHPQNGVYLPKRSCGTYHCGSHPGYSNAMTEFMGRLADARQTPDNPDGLDNDAISARISEAILKARENFGTAETGEGGLSLLDEAAWNGIFRAIF